MRVDGSVTGHMLLDTAAGFRMNPMHLGLELLAKAQNQSMLQLNTVSPATVCPDPKTDGPSRAGLHLPGDAISTVTTRVSLKSRPPSDRPVRVHSIRSGGAASSETIVDWYVSGWGSGRSRTRFCN